MATGKGQFVDFSDPSQVWRRPSTKHLRISTNVLYCQKQESLTYISATHSTGLRWLLSHNYLSKSNPLNQKLLVRKSSFTWYSQLRSFEEVIHFAINHRQTRGSISPYNTAGLISEVFEEVITQIAKKCSRRQPNSHLRPPPRGTPRMCARTCISYIARNYTDASFLQQSPFWPFKVVHGHPRSMILVPIESAYATS